MYSSLLQCVHDLEKHGHLVRIKDEIDPILEMAEIHRRIFDAGGPAILFENIKGCKFPAVSNIYGHASRIDFLFGKQIPLIKALGKLKEDPSLILKQPGTYSLAALKARMALPKKVSSRHLVHTCNIEDLPAIQSWPLDGGPFVLLPQVLTLPPGVHDIMKSNLGMYRIQLSGNDYITNEEIGLHYQLHRGIGVHHTQYLNSNEDFKVSIFIGGPPAHAVSAIFPLPENMSELTFAGLLNEKRFSYSIQSGFIISEQADFVITGTVMKNIQKAEGPFGDHLGYYSLKHNFPFLKVDKVYHRKDAIWHFTIVGRPPQEDSFFGKLIHEIVGDLIPKEFPGLKQLHAVDVAGVHPLLLAIGQERYMPFREKMPEESLTIANRLLGTGQTSLAKYLFIASPEENEKIDTHDYAAFFEFIFSRIHLDRDLHFITKTTVDTLDYSGQGWNAGSKVIIAACGRPVRILKNSVEERFSLYQGFHKPLFLCKGILCIQSPRFISYDAESTLLNQFINSLADQPLDGIVLIVLCDDVEFTSKNWDNFLWVTFTRSNPSHDIHGVNAFIEHKHWGCKGPLIIDARIKPHHAPVLEADPQMTSKVDQYFKKGGSLYGLDKKPTISSGT
ncbi:MAG: UbiD family decarboxylase [Saprospiraceae bacterium]